MDLRTLKFLTSENVAVATVLNRIPLFILAVILTCLLGTGIFRTTFNTSLSALLTQSDPYLNELEEMGRTFPSNGEIRLLSSPIKALQFSILKFFLPSLI